MKLFTRIVKFKDGRYAIRRLTVGGFRYKDLTLHRDHWWSFGSIYMVDCKGTFESVIQEVDRGKPLSKKEVEHARLINALK